MVVGMHFMGGIMPVFMAVAFLSGSAKQASDFVRGEVGDDFQAFLEFVCDAFDVVGFHDTEHYLFIYRQGYIYFSAFDYGGPVLVTYSVPQFHRNTDNGFRCFPDKSPQVDYEYGA